MIVVPLVIRQLVAILTSFPNLLLPFESLASYARLFGQILGILFNSTLRSSTTLTFASPVIETLEVQLLEC